MGSPSDKHSDVQSLLKLKRYEQPPRGYFEGLSHGVHQRLQGPEGLRQQSLLAALGLRFGVRPALFFALGVVCCLLSFYGLACLFTSGSHPNASNVPKTAAVMNSSANNSAVGSTASLSPPEPAQGSDISSTNPVLGYGMETYVRPMPVSYPKR